MRTDASSWFVDLTPISCALSGPWLVDPEQPWKAHTLGHEHDGTAAYAAHFVLMIVAGNNVAPSLTSRTGYVPGFRVAIGKADHAGRLRPIQKGQDFRRRKRVNQPVTSARVSDRRAMSITGNLDHNRNSRFAKATFRSFG